MHPHPNESALIQEARLGDEAALSELYRHYVDAVYRYMFYRTGDQMVAEDLTAEVFAQMITAIQRYKDAGLPLGAWLFRIARARLADYWRKTRRREKYQLVISEDAREILGSAEAPNPFKYEELETAFQYLTRAERDVLLLRFAGDMNNEEIALVVQSTPNAVKGRTFRALKKLRRILGRRQKFVEESRGHRQ